jgi:hypothetical protein
MPQISRAGVVSAVAAGACALALASPGAALAAGHHRPAARPFTAHGLVISHTSSSVTMLATDVRSGRSTTRNTPVTVSLPSRRSKSGKVLSRRLAHLSAGDRISVTGTKSGDALTAKNFVGQAAPFHVYLGTVTAVNGALVTVDKSTAPSDDQNESDNGSFTVDTTNATVLVDGAAGSLAVGQSVAILGSSVMDVVSATSVFAFSVAPAVLTGEVSAVNGTVVTVSKDGQDGEGDGGSQSGEDGGTPPTPPVGTTTDLAAATLIVDGASNATPDTVTVGSRLIALGTDNGDGTFTSTMVFAFTHACSSRHHGDGGQDSGQDG